MHCSMKLLIVTMVEVNTLILDFSLCLNDTVVQMFVYLNDTVVQMFVYYYAINILYK